MYSNKRIIQEVRGSQDGMENVTKQSGYIMGIRKNLNEWGGGKGADLSNFGNGVFGKTKRKWKCT